ncbi:hypothetical protein [Succinivibrio dextrinosolvens]|uniref:hypothetical protein n=1 Tax=Succinivibrio dextrinosolvens TaxID=83771 RepID=UPI0004E2256A|nr:hypothetical protein [Succinivibrio dextrinosolvens]
MGYEYAKYTEDNKDSPVDSGTAKVKRIPVFVNYKINPNFNVWAESGFNADSFHDDQAIEGLEKKVYR